MATVNNENLGTFLQEIQIYTTTDNRTSPARTIRLSILELTVRIRDQVQLRLESRGLKIGSLGCRMRATMQQIGQKIGIRGSGLKKEQILALGAKEAAK